MHDIFLTTPKSMRTKMQRGHGVSAEKGKNILLHKRSIAAVDVDHAMERHNAQAAAMGEEPLLPSDIARYGEMASSPDAICRGANPNSIILEKRYSDGTLYLVEQLLKNNKIEFRSMWKNKVAEKMRPALMGTLPGRIKGAAVEEGEE